MGFQFRKSCYHMLFYFLDNMKAISHYTHRIPASMHDDLIEDFVAALIKVNPNFKYFDDQGKSFKFPYEQLVIYARK